jgi:hypothetical protein
MATDPRVVAELREMFVAGATPSRLIRHIAGRHDGEPWPRLVGEYFAQAFSVVTVVADGWPETQDLDDVDPSELDRELLRDMVGRSHLWRPSNEADAPAWWDGLRSVAGSEPELLDRLRPEGEPALREVWDSLPERTRSHIRRATVNAAAYHQYTAVLTRLVERLQDQVLRLEQERELAIAGT